ncbi:hypothetical protein CesoFtcFv8_007741 [Champsocephalus esox]|uniref:Uncharacterized protein n=1 Tax=Champsocephalus esox TaxID=159716 RepID=A0AAN8H571_9TELE|nr:hypothetical protein CesoFtcFv8_007741 [Champsocephalus esox]
MPGSPGLHHQIKPEKDAIGGKILKEDAGSKLFFLASWILNCSETIGCGITSKETRSPQSPTSSCQYPATSHSH